MFGLDSQMMLTVGGYAHVTAQFENGDNVEIAYFGVDRKPIFNRDRWARVKRRFENGELVEWRYFGAEGEKVLSNEGYHLARADYDGRRNRIAIRLFDIDGVPVRHRDGHGREDFVYNAQGHRVELRFSDTANPPRLSVAKRGFAVFKTTVDPRGQPIEIQYLDQAGRLTHTKEGVARNVREHNAGQVVRQQHFDGLGNPVADRGTGCFTCSALYDDRGRISEETCDDAETRPEWRRGYEYDMRGRRILELNFAVASPPGDSRTIAGLTRFEYDERGNEIHRAWFDANSEPAVIAEGDAAIERTYDERGNLIWRELRGADGKAAELAPEVEREVREYDSFDREIERRFLGPGKLLVAGPDGAATIRFTYDSRGQIIREQRLDPAGRDMLAAHGTRNRPPRPNAGAALPSELSTKPTLSTR